MTAREQAQLLTLTEVCGLLKCSRWTVQRLVHNGRLKRVCLTGNRRHMRYRLRDVVAITTKVPR